MTDQPLEEELLPAGDALRNLEAEAAAFKRSLVVEPERLGALLAAAQQVMNDFQRGWVATNIVKTHDERSATPIIAAARIIFDLATAPTPKVELEERDRLLILAASAFAMAGNFPSAAAAFRLISSDREWTSGEAFVLSLALFGDATSPLISLMPPEAVQLHRHLHSYLMSGDRNEAKAAWDLFGSVARNARTAWDGALIRSARPVIAQLIVLALSQHLSEHRSATFNAYVRSIINQKRFTLLPPQSQIIVNGGLLDSSDNALLTLPTSTGKTLLAELAIAQSLDDVGSVAIYVAPYIALGRQVFDCISHRAPDFVEVRGHFGTFNSSALSVRADQRTILVVTPERLDGILRANPAIYANLRAVVFDEAHGIEGGSRGLRLEAIIARLKLQQRQHRKLRIVLLSAVLTNGEIVRQWLGENAVHYDHSWRPTARRIAFWYASGELSWLYGNDPLRPSDKQSVDEFASFRLAWPSPQQPTQTHSGLERERPKGFVNVSELARELYKRDPNPILIACATKASTRGVAASIAIKLTDKVDLPTRLAELAVLIEATYPHLKALAGFVRRGVAYHNASLPSDIRRVIEEAISDRELDYVAATTTLAEGVDLPFRATIIFEWLVGFGENQTPMSPLVFRNIAGRCGRAGQYVEGDTIVFDNMVGNLAYTANHVRWAAQARLLGDPPPLLSAANENADLSIYEANVASLSSQLLAAIPENPNSDAIELELARSMYASQVGFRPDVMLQRCRADLLSDAYGEPFAMAASPMWLTPLGKAANRSGFGAQSCRAMIDFLRTVQKQDSEKLAADLLNSLGELQEQPNYLLAAIAGNRRTQFYVKSADMESLAKGWLAGTTYTEMFLALPAAGRSQARVTPAVWATGVEYERVAAQYDKFVDLVEYAFGNYLIWVLRALAELSNHVERDDEMPNWLALADEFSTAREVDDAAKDGSSAAENEP